MIFIFDYLQKQRFIDIAISYQKSTARLHLLVDSTGLKFLSENVWKLRLFVGELPMAHPHSDSSSTEMVSIELKT